MLDTLVSLATIVGAIPATVAAVVFLGKTLPAYFAAPEGLHLEVVRAVGDPGYFVRVTNYDPVERHIEYVGVMPAKFRPVWPPWVRTTRRISAKRNSVYSLSGYTIEAKLDFTLPSGKSWSFLVPQPFGPDAKTTDWSVQKYRAFVERDAQWCRDYGGRPPIVPYVRLAAGNMVLGKKVRLKKATPGLPMLCHCGHSVDRHQSYKRKRLAAEMAILTKCDTCKCRHFAAAAGPETG